MTEQEQINQTLQRQLDLKDMQISELIDAYYSLKKFVQYGFAAISIGLFVLAMR